MTPCPRASGCSPKPSSPTVAVAPGRRSMVPANRGCPLSSIHSMAHERMPRGSCHAARLRSTNDSASSRV